MANSPRPVGAAPPRAPRWVKVSAIIVGVLIVLAVIVMLAGVGGEHGPGRHMGAAGTPPIGATVWVGDR